MITLADKKEERARGVALKVLQEVFEKGAYSNIALNKELQASQLSQADKGLVTELVYGTVARKITLEWYLAHEFQTETNWTPGFIIFSCSVSTSYSIWIRFPTMPLSTRLSIWPSEPREQTSMSMRCCGPS